MLSAAIQVLRHEKTGLLMAMTLNPDLRGFVVHAHSIEEMQAKLVPAFRSYLEAIK